jgi:hypothetical protein
MLKEVCALEADKRGDLVDLVHLVSSAQPNKPDKLNKPNNGPLLFRWRRGFSSIAVENYDTDGSHHSNNQPHHNYLTE